MTRHRVGTARERLDGDLERQVEAWLTATAVPAPGDLLQDVVGSLPRQDRASRLGSLRETLSRWLRGPAFRLALGGTAVAILVASAAFLPGLGQTPVGSSSRPSPRTWDPAVDFRTGAAARNPSPDRYGNANVWSYRFAFASDVDPTTYPLLTAFDFPTGSWVAPQAGVLGLGVQGGAVALRPASPSADSARVLLGWTSPSSGLVTLHGTFAAPAVGCSGLLRASIERAGVSHWLADLAPGANEPFDLSFDIASGSSVYFSVVPIESATCSSILLTLRITAAAG